MGRWSVRIRSEVILLVLTAWMIGCQWEPSQRQLRNARAFEALLTAVSLKNVKEVEADAQAIKALHDSGEMSDDPYAILEQVIKNARAKDWATAEKLAYEFRARFGDDGAYFK